MKTIFLFFLLLITLVPAIFTWSLLPCSASTIINIGSLTKLINLDEAIITYSCGNYGYIRKVNANGNITSLSNANSVAYTCAGHTKSIALSNGNILIVINNGWTYMYYGIISSTGTLINGAQLYNGLLGRTAEIATFSTGDYVISWLLNSPRTINFQRFSEDGVPAGSPYTSGIISGMNMWSQMATFPTSDNIIIVYNKALMIFFRIYSKEYAQLCQEYQVFFIPNTDVSQPDVKVLSDTNFVVCWKYDTNIYCQTYNLAFSPSCIITTLSPLVHIPDVVSGYSFMDVITHSNSSYFIAYSQGTFIYTDLYSVDGALCGKYQTSNGSISIGRLYGVYLSTAILLIYNNSNNYTPSYYALVDTTSPIPPTCSNYNIEWWSDTPLPLDFTTYLSHSSMNLKVSFFSLPSTGNFFRTGDASKTAINLRTIYLSTELSFIGSSGTFQILFKAVGNDLYHSIISCTLTIKVCYLSCQTCLDIPGTATNHECLTCLPAYYPLSDQKTSCFQNPHHPHYYFNEDEKMHKPCYSTCYNCFGEGTIDSHKCTECARPYYLYENNNCIDICPDYTYIDTNAYVCVNCKSLNQFFFKGTCVATVQRNWKLVSEEYNAYEECPGLCCEGYYFDKTSQKCIACTSPCQTCIDEKTCLSCIQIPTAIYYLYNSKCVTSCPEDSFLSSEQTICVSCNPACSKCTNPSPYCMECKSSAIYKLIISENFDNINRQCLFSCPAEYYPDSSNNCTRCTEGGYEIKDGKCVVAPRSFVDCVEKFFLDNPSLVPIYQNLFRVQLVFSMKSDCGNDDTSTLVTFQWKDLYGGKLENKNQTLVLNIENFEEGIKVFEVTMLAHSKVVTTISQKSYFKKPKLVPIVEHENNLQFLMGFDIIIDASLSYDEAFTSQSQNSNLQDESLNFTWTCPPQFQAKCSITEGNILTVKPSEYKDIDPRSTFAGIIVLTLSKNLLKQSQSLKFSISPVINNNSTNSTAIPSLDEIIQIFSNSRGTGEETIFEMRFMNSTLNAYDFSYLWSINSIISNDAYLNGRQESSLKIKSNSLGMGEHTVELQIKRKNENATYLKKYIFTKVIAPYGGNCVVSPPIGQSLVTNFTFSMEGWQSPSSPLKYKIFSSYENKTIPLTDDFILENKFSTWITPVSDKVFVDIMDANGGIATVQCNVQIRRTSNINLTLLINNASNPQQKLLILESSHTNSPLNENMISKALDILVDSNLLSSNKTIGSNVFNLLEIASKTQDKESQEKIYNITVSMTNKVESFMQDESKISSLLTTINNNMNSSSSNEFLAKNEDLTWKIVTTIQDNIIPGEIKKFETPTALIQVAKFSPLNINDFSVSTDPNTSSMRCSNVSVICLDQKQLSTFSSKFPIFGVTAKYNKENKLPIKIPTFSKDSLEFHIKDTSKVPSLELEEGNNFTINLNIESLDQNSTVGESLCLHYERNMIYDEESCETWYNYEEKKGVCICNKPGLIVNVVEKTFSNVNKMKQFPIPSAKLCIDCFLVGLVVILLSIATIRDRRDRKKQVHIKYSDPKQYYMTRLQIEGFHLSLSFRKLFFYMIKISHPIASVLSIYSPEYSRALRLMDFLIKLHFSFFFSLLPYYYTTNDEFEIVKALRNIQNRGKLVDDFEVKVSQIINGLLYWVSGSIASVICVMILNLIMYKDIRQDEAQRIATSKRLLHEDVKGVKSYQRALENAKKILKAVLILVRPREFKKNSIRDVKISPIDEDQLSNSSNSKSLLQFDLISSREIPAEDTKFGDKNSCLRLFLNLEIIKACQFETISSISTTKKDLIYKVTSQNRSFGFIKMESVMNGSYLSIITLPKQQKFPIILFIRSWLKFILCLVLLILFWYYNAVFALSIYENFGNNFFKICVMPLISMLFLNLILVEIVMIFISCILMKRVGKSIETKKKFSIVKIFYKALVSPYMHSHYLAILSFHTIPFSGKLQLRSTKY